MALSGGQFLQDLRLESPRAALLLERVINGLNTISDHLGVDPTGKAEPPNQIPSISVMPGPDMVHVTLNDTSPLHKNEQNFLEHSVDGGLTWHMNHLGASRGINMPLPTMNSGGTTYNYFFRAYKQRLGSDAQSEHTYLGSAVSPMTVNLTGTAKMDLLPSAGGGTAPPNGQQAGQGLGTALSRPAQTQKRPNLNSNAA